MASKPKITKQDADAAWDMFQNQDRLLACKGHQWIKDGPRFKCPMCGGYASRILKEMYEQGKKHGGAK